MTHGIHSYEEMSEHYNLIGWMDTTIREMEKVEGFASTEDSYTARIPGSTLRRWRDVLKKAYFKLNKDIG